MSLIGGELKRVCKIKGSINEFKFMTDDFMIYNRFNQYLSGDLCCLGLSSNDTIRIKISLMSVSDYNKLLEVGLFSIKIGTASGNYDFKECVMFKKEILQGFLLTYQQALSLYMWNEEDFQFIKDNFKDDDTFFSDVKLKFGISDFCDIEQFLVN